MHDITKHDSEEEWEGDTCEQTWICLFIPGYAISIHNLLSTTRKAIGDEQRGILWVWQFEQLRTRRIFSFQFRNEFPNWFKPLIWYVDPSLDEVIKKLHLVKLMIYFPLLDYENLEILDFGDWVFRQCLSHQLLKERLSFTFAQIIQCSVV